MHKIIPSELIYSIDALLEYKTPNGGSIRELSEEHRHSTESFFKKLKMDYWNTPPESINNYRTSPQFHMMDKNEHMRLRYNLVSGIYLIKHKIFGKRVQYLDPVDPYDEDVDLS